MVKKSAELKRLNEQKILKFESQIAEQNLAIEKLKERFYLIFLYTKKIRKKF